MLELDNVFMKFCEVLPNKVPQSEEDKKKLFELMLKIVYNYMQIQHS